MVPLCGDDAFRVVVQLRLAGGGVIFDVCKGFPAEAQLLPDLFVPLKELDGVPPALFLGEAGEGLLLNAGQGLLHAPGKPAGRNGRFPACRADRPFRGLHHAAAPDGGNLHHLAAQGLTELFRIQPVAVPVDHVHHIDRRHHGDAQLQQLGGQVQVPLQVGAVDDIQNGVGPLLRQIVPCRLLLRGVGGQGINAGQVGNGHILPAFPNALLFLHGDAGPVAHVLVRARQGVEQGGLAGIGVARQGNGDAHGKISPSIS